MPTQRCAQLSFSPVPVRIRTQPRPWAAAGNLIEGVLLVFRAAVQAFTSSSSSSAPSASANAT
eukprot:2718522-Pyramimonas_sp.AAC.1